MSPRVIVYSIIKMINLCEHIAKRSKLHSEIIHNNFLFLKKILLHFFSNFEIY